jgi:copper resistance protein B
MMRVAWAALVLAVLVPGRAAAIQHEGHGQPKPRPAEKPTGHDHASPAEGTSQLPPFIKPITDDDRKAAFPDVEGHAVHDEAMHYLVLFDQLEWQAAGSGSGINLDTRGWFGRDIDRMWFRAEGDAEDGRIGAAEAELFYGRRFSRWWDVVAGVRQDFDPGRAQTWAAIGVQGLAPYWFEVEATFYIGASGRTHVRGEIEYELLLTNRLMLQPLVEIDLYGKSDPERGTGAGLSTTDAGLRLRYELRRELAPYIGVTWQRKYGGTRDLAEAAGEPTGGARFVTGLRLWF